ncbi:uncharacterized protein SCODWIG_02752 [Saccharomycodes ludwigii]|uniref:Uncharacterized protein n=1 Tax=Saccharomycodes ludwigii TaxID=36035 RepID=A0A376B8Q1_9ASCO|nr:uncharacterized protein SCODWIG_02752 [Saccharomycodes ludwigii]
MIKNIRDVKILMITKDPVSVYTEKLRVLDEYLPPISSNEQNQRGKVANNDISWRQSKKLKSVSKNYKPKGLSDSRMNMSKEIIDLNTANTKNKNINGASNNEVEDSETEIFGKIISVQKLKKLKKGDLNALFKAHDVVMCDHRVVHLLPKILGSTFYNHHKKVPFTIKFTRGVASHAKASLKKGKTLTSRHHSSANKLSKFQIAKQEIIDPKYIYTQMKSVLKNTFYILPSGIQERKNEIKKLKNKEALLDAKINPNKKTTNKDDTSKNNDCICLSINVGNIKKHTTDEIKYNIQDVIEYVGNNLIKNVSAHDSNMYLKTANSISLPI